VFSLRSGSGKKLHYVTVGILKIDAAPATPSVDLHILLRERTAPIRNASLLDSSEDRIELRVADVESVVVHLEMVTRGTCLKYPKLAAEHLSGSDEHIS